MATDTKAEYTIQFDLFELDPRNYQLRRNGLPIDLPPQTLRILALLAARPNELITRKEIKDALWPGENHGDFDSRLNVAVKELREALGDDAERPRYVQTVRKAGYRFIAPVRTPVREPQISAVSAILDPADVHVIRESRHKQLATWKTLLVGFALGVAAFGSARWIGRIHSKPIIMGVSAVSAENQEIRIVGHGLGRHRPFNLIGLDTPYLMVGDDTAHWMAAKMDPDRVSDVTVLVSDWSDTLVTIKGFSGMYGQGPPNQGNWKLHPGDKLRIRLWNPQYESAGFAECLMTVGGEDAVCSK